MQDSVTTSLPFATFFLSVAVGAVAWLQWRVARNKLRLDLFDRRYKVFEATRKFLEVILRDAGFENSHWAEFNLATSDAKFLFGSDVVDWLAEVRKQAAHLRTTRTLLSRPPKDDAQLAKLAEAEEKDLAWLVEQINAMTTVFIPYLGFAHVK